MLKIAEVLCAVFGILRDFPGFQVLTLVNFHGFHVFHRFHGGGGWVEDVWADVVWGAGARLWRGRSVDVIRPGRSKVSAHNSISEPVKVRGGAVPSVVGGEWNCASERRSIQPRVPLQASGELKQIGCGRGRKKGIYAEFAESADQN
jgi:hypothetical protein